MLYDPEAYVTFIYILYIVIVTLMCILNLCMFYLGVNLKDDDKIVGMRTKGNRALKISFSYGAKGSKIIFTTHNKEVT